MRVINLQFEGNVGQDAKTGTGKNGFPWAMVSVGVPTSEKYTLWITAWASVGTYDKISKLNKGDRVLVTESTPKLDEYEKDGIKHTRLSTTVWALELMAKGKKEESKAAPPAREPGQDPDNIPF